MVWSHTRAMVTRGSGPVGQEVQTQELQGKLLLKEPKLTPAVRAQAIEILDRVSNRQFGRPSM